MWPCKYTNSSIWSCMQRMSRSALQRAEIEGAGAVLYSPPDPHRCSGVVLFLAGLGSTKEKLAASKRTAIFEAAGYACILADHYNEGERRDPGSLSNRAGWTRSQKKYFWPPIYLTASVTVPALVSFAHTTYSTSQVFAYGSSMGGDIFLTSLACERRIIAVALERATPDWMRPNSTANVLGEDEAGDQLYELHAPCNNLGSYVCHPTAILFISGESDTHVPRACAEKFVAALCALGSSSDAVQSTVLPSAGWEGHILCKASEATERALDFFACHAARRVAGGDTDAQCLLPMPTDQSDTWPQCAPEPAGEPTQAAVPVGFSELEPHAAQALLHGSVAGHSAIRAVVGGRPLAIFAVAEQLYAIDADCPHQGASLHLGDIESTTTSGPCVMCPRHGWCFNLLNGWCDDLNDHAVRTYEVRRLPNQRVCVANP